MIIADTQIATLYAAVNRVVRLFKFAEAEGMTSKQSEGLNLSDVHALLLVGVRGTCIVSDVVRELRVPPTTATSIVDRLVRRNLVQRARTEENRRIVRLSLTPQGEGVRRAAMDQQMRHCRAMLEALEARERETFVRLISKIAAYSAPV
jgi:DNA-binding MarR family transcriptional regulator